MTDRTISLLVTLDKEYRTDDAETIIDAINMIKGVLSVKTIVTGTKDYMNAHSYKRQIISELYERLNKAFEE